jgi:hypothetical protein
MATTSAERVSAWRQRLALKADFFDHLNAERVRRLGFDPADDRPEYAAVRAYMANYPRASSAPLVAFSREEGGWFVDFERHDPTDEAVAALAMLSVTSAAVFIRVCGDGSGSMVPASEAVARQPQVRAEIDEMKRLGLWGA